MLRKISIAAVAGVLVIGSAFYAVPAVAQGVRQKPVPPDNVGATREKHPIIRKSISQLERVEQELAKADNDFGGHKEKARDLIRNAIDQLKVALKSDKH